MSNKINISTPLNDEVVARLKIGDSVLITGTLYTARDAAHKRLIELIRNGKNLPFDLEGQIIYYVGPSPTPPGRVIGSAGPTTSGRMDALTPTLLDMGLKGMIGKGKRSQEVIDSMKKNKAVYFAAIGGAGVIMANSIKKTEIVAYEDLGPEAIVKLEVVDFPVFVINDIYGNDLYKNAINEFKID